MADKTVEDILNESEENPLLNPWITIEAAASRMALGRVVKGEEWRENEKIQEWHKALYDEAYKVEEHLQRPMKLGDVFEWIKNNDHMNKEVMAKYSEERHYDLMESLIAAMQRIFFLNVDIDKTFREIYLELHAEYGAHLFSNRTVTDLENIEGYKYPQKDEGTKTARAIFMIVLNAIMAEADKFGLVPQFTPDEETEPNYFYFHPVSYREDAAKGCLEVKVEGIKAWLKYNNTNDEYYNLASEKPEDEYWDILNPKGDYFAPKLSALIRAWREATNPKSEYYFKKYDKVKDAIEACLKKHAEAWHLTDEDNSLSDDSIKRLTRIANWDDKPGLKNKSGAKK